MIGKLSLALVFFFFTAFTALAVLPGEQLSDPILEERARKISKSLRCVVCQNQSIDASNAELAADMRKVVRERIVAGDNDQQVTQYIVDRYGAFVLLKPPLKTSTYALWFGPLGFIIFGFLIFWQSSKRKQTAQTDDKTSNNNSHEIDQLLKKLGK